MFYVVAKGLKIDGPGTRTFTGYADAVAYAMDRREYWRKRGEAREWEIFKVEKLWSTISAGASANFKA